MDCRPRLTSSIIPWFRIRVYLLLDGLPTKAIELHLPGFGIRSCPSPRLCRSAAPYSVLFRCNPPEGGLPNPPPRGRAPTPYSPSAGYRDLSPKQIYRIHENEKKRKYNFRVTEIGQGTFTPLVFTTTGGMAEECLRYHSRLAELVSAKKQESYATTISWVRAKVSFAILRSALVCLRGSRTPRRRNLVIKDSDLEIEKGQAGLP